jgi:hypothetical protein
MPLPAPTYIKHIQTWVGGKVLDPSLFPMDPFTSAPSIPSAAQAAADPNYWLRSSLLAALARLLGPELLPRAQHLFRALHQRRKAIQPAQ